MRPAQRLILGIKEPLLSKTAKRLFTENEIGGVVLFDRNIQNRDQLKALVEEIKACCKIKPFIGIDFEGGNVRRKGELFSALDAPSKYSVDFNRLKADCENVADEFREIGINLNFAPVADLSYTPLNPALAGRTFAFEPSLTAEYCLNFIKAFRSRGILCCLKHFPGLGSAANDPHHKTAISKIKKKVLEANDFVPYKAGVAAGVEMIMTTHVLIPDLDDKIATFSRNVIDIARFIGFDGIIVSDDLSMGAINRGEAFPEKTLKTLVAGHDMALICHDHDKHEEIASYLDNNLPVLKENGHIRVLERIADVKSKLP